MQETKEIFGLDVWLLLKFGQPGMRTAAAVAAVDIECPPPPVAHPL